MIKKSLNHVRRSSASKKVTQTRHASDWKPSITGLGPRPPNLLILGASGHVAQAFLTRLQNQRARFGRIVLLDPSERVLQNLQLDHKRLEYRFVRRRLRFPEDTVYFHRLLALHRIDLVLDVTDLDTMPVLNATDAAGVCYVNTALNDANRGVAEVLENLHPTREQPRNAPHIISSGMNPGVVNIWVWDAFRRFGRPVEIIHFEYDTSAPREGWRPMITWSRQEFLTETVWERTGLVVNGRLRMLESNALKYRHDMRSVLEPVMSLTSYPRGFLVLHEENIKLGRKLGVSSKYLYAVHPRTMDHLERVWLENGTVSVEDLEIGDNSTVPLEGADTIGLCLRYPDKQVYYLHALNNTEVRGANATCFQVAVGIEAALATLRLEPLSPRIYFASDLYDTVFRDHVFRSLRVEISVLPTAVSPEPLGIRRPSCDLVNLDRSLTPGNASAGKLYPRHLTHQT